MWQEIFYIVNIFYIVKIPPRRNIDMSLELSKSGMGPDTSVKFGEFSPLGSMTSLEERKKERTNERTNT